MHKYISDKQLRKKILQTSVRMIPVKKNLAWFRIAILSILSTLLRQFYLIINKII